MSHEIEWTICNLSKINGVGCLQSVVKVCMVVDTIGVGLEAEYTVKELCTRELIVLRDRVYNLLICLRS